MKKTWRAVFLAVLALLSLGRPDRSLAQAEERLVLAFYYTWYDENTWTPALTPDAPATPYVSRERATIERHVAQAQQAGIDAFVVSWWGPREEDNQTETNLRALLDVAQARGFYVTVDFELTSPFYAGPADVVAALRYLLANHARHPAFLRYGGRPVVFFWRQQVYDAPTWADLRQQVDPARATLWIAEGVDLSYQAVFDGCHLYNITWNPPTDPAYTAAKFRRLIDEYNAAHDAHKLWIAAAMPGYDDTHVAGRPGVYAHPRQDGAYYRQTWQAAIASRPDMVVVTSFNEWREGTMIEPSVTYGDLYLNLTAEWAAAYKNSAPPSPTPWPAATVTPAHTAAPTAPPTATASPRPCPTATRTAAPSPTATRAPGLVSTATATDPAATPTPSPPPPRAPGRPALCGSLSGAAALPLLALAGILYNRARARDLAKIPNLRQVEAYTASPTSSTASPTSNTVSPISNTASSASDTASPISNTASSASDTASPISNTASSASDTASPISNTASSASDTASPISNTASSASDTVVPIVRHTGGEM